MRNKYTIFLLSFFFCSSGIFAQTVTYNYTGAMQTYTVPPCVTSLTIQASGAKGGGSNGGNGATVSGVITVTPGDVLEVWVGGMGTAPGAGFNGGGAGTTAGPVANYGYGGGGASDVRVPPYGLGSRVIVASGGGGTGGGNTAGAGGTGGCASGNNGSSPFGQGGFGASSTAGGAGGPPWISSGFAGSPGSFGQGGAGATDPCYNLGPGGGGGGGYYGGGGGGSDCFSSGSLGGGGGGGGSSLTPAGGTCNAGVNASDGVVTITPGGGGSTMNITPTAPNICIGDNVVLNASGAMTYTWSPATGLSATTGATVTASPTTTTTYTLHGIGACNDSLQVTVIVDPVPTVNVSSISICNGASGTLTATGATTYDWTPATGLSATTGSSVTANPTTTTTYTITGHTPGGCVSSTTATVTVNPIPVVNVNSGSVCSGGTVTLTATGADTYTWTPATGLSATTGATVLASPPSTTTYTVTGTTLAGCSSTATGTATIVTTPVINVAPASICNGASATLNATGASTYTWSPATGLSATTGSSVTANPTTTTTYTVSGTNATGCVGTTTVTVTVNPLPVLSVPPITVCNGTPEPLTASGAATYTWSPSTGLSATTGATVMASPSGTTTYIITGTSAAGCVSITSVLVTVDVLPTISAAGATICSGTSATLNASGAATYTWTPSTGLSATTGATVTASPTVTTNYTLTGTSATGCNNSIVVTVTVQATPNVMVPTPTDICIGDTTSLTASGASTYTWSPATGLSATTGTTVMAYPSTTQTYTVTGTLGPGCVGSTTVTVTIINPAAAATPNPGSGVEPLPVSFDNNSGGSFFIWDFGNGTGDTTNFASPDASTTYDTAGIYTVMLISIDGFCFDTTYFNVEVLPQSSLLVPNIITANNDGKNDNFKVIGVALKSLDVKIFNRWGQQVGTINAPDGSWDGANNSEGTYYYLLKAEGLEGAIYEQQGNFSLVK